MGVNASVCDCDTVPTHRCVYKEKGERGGKKKIPLTYEKTKPDRRRSNQLVYQDLLGHDINGSARVESVQPLVPVVHTGSQGGTHSKHAAFRNKKTQIC